MCHPWKDSDQFCRLQLGWELVEPWLCAEGMANLGDVLVGSWRLGLESPPSSSLAGMRQNSRFDVLRPYRLPSVEQSFTSPPLN